MAVYRVDVVNREAVFDSAAAAMLRETGLAGVERVRSNRVFLLEGDLSRTDVVRSAVALLVDPATERSVVTAQSDVFAPSRESGLAVEVHFRPGVMDPVAESTRAELRAVGLAVEAVRTARRYVVEGRVDAAAVVAAAKRVLANDCIEQIVAGAAPIRPAPRPPEYAFELRHVTLRALDVGELEKLSRAAHLFLSREEMLAIQMHFRDLEREPTDLELETIAQTWSEHCVHKTLRSAIEYRGAAMPSAGTAEPGAGGADAHSQRYRNLLQDTIGRVTRELMIGGRGPQCLSVFRDNAGVIAFDERFGIAFKVETHNHPSAIEPYGGAATGVGGVVRDVIGCGLGAKPIANTDIFCVAPADWPQADLPRGVLHPGRVLRGIVRGVADYGNRMGIPTVNGALYFDPRYLGNPLVYCGCVGLLPRDRVEKEVQAGDLVVVVGGRTGRDGIHGATFSSAELTDTHADEFSHAVQIGNAITEKRFLDAILQARDADEGCLYSAVTDCGAGGLSSAVGEMAAEVGAVVDLEKVPLKYAGLRYDEIWISEAQERMVVAVAPQKLERFHEIMRREEVEATVIGTFGSRGPGGAARLLLRYAGQVVGDLETRFLHDGLPKRERAAEWWGGAATAVPAETVTEHTAADVLDRLHAELARPNVASNAGIVRQYDHEVQGGTVVKPLLGPGRGPGDAAVLRPRSSGSRGVAIGCGLAPHLSDIDPYWMAAAAIDEAVRNVISVGGDPEQTALLDNFCWGRSDDPQQLGGLVRACQACYDVAAAYGTPFISGKDSLNNEFALDESDVEPLLAVLRARAQHSDTDARRLRAVLPELAARLRARRRLAIPGTLLVSAISIVPDVRRCMTSDLKTAGSRVLLVGGWPQVGFAPTAAAKAHRAVGGAIAGGLLRACHDVSTGGWLTTVAEMAIGGERGVELAAWEHAACRPFEEVCAAYVVEAIGGDAADYFTERGVACVDLGAVRADGDFRLGDRMVALAALRAAWMCDGHATPA